MIFSDKKLGQAEAVMSETAKENTDYVCGGLISPNGHLLILKIGVRTDITCTSDISTQYYASKHGFPLVCYKYGSKEPVEIPADVKATFQSVHPVCLNCKQSGQTPQTRGKKKLRRLDLTRVVAYFDAINISLFKVYNK